MINLENILAKLNDKIVVKIAEVYYFQDSSTLVRTEVPQAQLDAAIIEKALEEAAEVITIKWAEYYQYADTDILPYAAESGNVYSIVTASLISVKDKIESLAAAESVLWVEDGATFQTNKVELLEVFKEAEKLKQIKLIELFGA